MFSHRTLILACALSCMATPSAFSATLSEEEIGVRIDRAWDLVWAQNSVGAMRALGDVPADWEARADHERFEVLIRAGDLATLRGRYQLASERYEQAAARAGLEYGSTSPQYLKAAARAAMPSLRDSGQSERWLAVAEALVDEVYPEPSVARARLEWRLVTAQLSNVDERPRLAKRVQAVLDAVEKATDSGADARAELSLEIVSSPDFAVVMTGSDAVRAIERVEEVYAEEVGSPRARSRLLRARARLSRRAPADPEVKALYEQGRFEEASALVQEALHRARAQLEEARALLESLGDPEAEKIRCLYELALVQQDPEAAAEALERANAVSLALYGVKDPHALIHLSSRKASDPDEALKLAREALETTIELYGEATVHSLSPLIQIGVAELHRYRADPTAAGRRRVVAAQERTLALQADLYGAESSTYASFLNAAVSVYQQVGETERALAATKEAERILSQGGDPSALVATAASYLTVERNYAKAIELYEEIVAKGPDSWRTDPATTFGGFAAGYLGARGALADLYVTVGHYGSALEQYGALLEETREAAQRDAQLRSHVASWKLAVAMIHLRLGELEPADELLRELQTDFADEIMIRSSVEEARGDLALRFGRAEEAAAHYRASLATLTSQFPKELVESMAAFGGKKQFGLAMAYAAMGRREEAEPLIQRALELDSEQDNPSGVAELRLLEAARFYSSGGRHGEALALIDDAIEMLRSRGRDQPALAAALVQRGATQLVMGRPEAAVGSMIEALATLEHFIERLSLWAGEARLQSYLRTIDGWYDSLYTMLADHHEGQSVATLRAFEQHLSYRGRVVEILTERTRLALLSRDPALGLLISRITALSKQIANLSLAPPPDLPDDFIDALESERQKLEEQLARSSSVPAERAASAGVTARALTSALPEHGAYIDFVSYDRYDHRLQRLSGERHYLVFVATSDPTSREARVEVYDLGPAGPIEDLVARLRQQLIAPSEKPRGDAKGPPGSLREGPEVGELLHRVVWGPFADRLAGVEHIVVSPAGALNLIPFELLKEPARDGFLGDRIGFTYGLGRDYARGSSKRTPGASEGPESFVIVASPDFDAAPEGSPRRATETLATPSLRRGAVDGWPIVFEDLPGALREAAAIEGVVKSRNVETVLGAAATEPRIKSTTRPDILHLATHGFFLSDVEHESEVNSRGVLGVRPTVGWQRPARDPELDDPLLRSGLAFAGANRLAAGVPIPEGADDGILTAFEVTAMDLTGTRLVVLSACETGLGDMQRGEGVIGLRRAFRIAGARSVVMSLWEIPDEETAWLMESFYREIERGIPLSRALQTARRELRERLVQRDGHADPFFWGSFVLEGTE